ncbi:MAG: pseudouridine synthase [Pseudomonadota bacterium]
MTERRETGRDKGKSPSSPSRRGGKAPRKKKRPEPDWSSGERIAKYLARCGVASRRACEALIEDGKVTVNGERLVSPAFKVTGREDIRVGRQRVAPPEPSRLWRYHKPAGLLTTNSDPDGRQTIFDQLPKTLPRTVTIGRLDLNTEGLLLLTNDGELARALELPANAFERTYRARAHGRITQDKLDTLKDGIVVDGEIYGEITATLERQTGANSWITVTLKEGKKREVRRALEFLELQVNRLIRISYGPFLLGDLKPGAISEVSSARLQTDLGDIHRTLRRHGAATSRFEPGEKRTRIRKTKR